MNILSGVHHNLSLNFPCALPQGVLAVTDIGPYCEMSNHCMRCQPVCLFQDDDLEEGEVKDPNDRKVRPRPTCRFFMKGNGML